MDAHYTKRVGLQQLFMTTLSYDAETMTVSWDKVPNAIGYSLRVGSSEKSASHIIESGNKMQYTLTEQTSGKYIVNVIAKGDGLSHSDSDSVTLTVDYVKIIELPPLSMSPLSFDSESKNEHLGVLNTVLKYHLEKKRSDEKLILNRSVNPFYPIEQKDIDLS